MNPIFSTESCNIRKPECIQKKSHRESESQGRESQVKRETRFYRADAL
jgi:hypothetical protein